MKHRVYIRVSHFEQHEPGVVPAPRTLRVRNHRPLGLVHAFGSQRVGLCKSTELGQEVIMVDIVRPSGS